jgi:hypothetical protein
MAAQDTRDLDAQVFTPITVTSAKATHVATAPPTPVATAPPTPVATAPATAIVIPFLPMFCLYVRAMKEAGRVGGVVPPYPKDLADSKRVGFPPNW